MRRRSPPRWWRCASAVARRTAGTPRPARGAGSAGRSDGSRASRTPLVLIRMRVMAGGPARRAAAELGVQGRFAAAEHQHVEPAVLAGQALVDVGQHVGDRDHAAGRARSRRNRWGSAGCRSRRCPRAGCRCAGSASRAARGDSRRDRVEVAAMSGVWALVGAVHLQLGQDLGVSSYRVRTSPCVGQPRSSQTRPSRSASQPLSRGTSASGRSGCSSWQWGQNAVT